MSQVATAAAALRTFRWWLAVREFVALGALFVFYKLGRTLMFLDSDVAFDNAHRVVAFERILGLPDELWAQNVLLAEQWSVGFVNSYYMTVHFPATAACLIWVYVRRPALYPALRAGLIGMTGLSLVVHLTFPLAPPRMLDELGFVDTGAVFGPGVYGPPEESGMLNQFAAMPSLHVGWAVLIAAALVAATSSPWRWLWVLHPTITVVAVVGSANHYWIDGLVACGLLGISLAVWRRLAKREPAAPPPARELASAGSSSR
jgi:hypothetical protein